LCLGKQAPVSYNNTPASPDTACKNLLEGMERKEEQEFTVFPTEQN